MVAEVTVQNPMYWTDRALQLAQIFSTAAPLQTIGDPQGLRAEHRAIHPVRSGHWGRRERV